MSVENKIYDILDELKNHSGKIDKLQIQQYLDEIISSKRIFVAGAGRSGLAIKAFAMRLMHLGKNVYVLGDVTTPNAQAGDLLLIGSGSGETKSLVSAAKKAKSINMKILLNTIDKTSTLAQLADVIVVLPGGSQKVENSSQKTHSLQPMGSSYEQLSLIFYDAIVWQLMEILNQTGDEMFTRHGNIE